MNDNVDNLVERFYNDSNVKWCFDNASRIATAIKDDDRFIHNTPIAPMEQLFDAGAAKPRFNKSSFSKVAIVDLYGSIGTYCKLKPKVLDYVSEGCSTAIKSCSQRQSYDNLLNGKTEFIHHLVAQGLLNEDTFTVCKKICIDLIKEHIHMLIDEYSKDSMEHITRRKINPDFPFKITSMAVNITKQYDYHPIHDHQSDFAAGIYLVVDEEQVNNAAGCFGLVLPGSQNSLTAPPNHLFQVSPRAGDCLLWTGNLQHYMLPCFKPGDRIMLTFNANWNYDN